MIADTVLVNGNVLTMNPSQPLAEAVAIKNARIAKVGKNSEIAELIGKNTRVIDLQRKTLLPGLIDTHIHVADFGRTLTWVDLKHTDSIKTLLNKIKDRAQKTNKGKWIIGFGFDQESYAEKRYPKREELDDASPENPLIIYHQLGRTCIANTKALKLAGVTKDTVSQKDGVIDKNAETGEPTGVLHGCATDLIWNAIPAPNEQDIMEAAKVACIKIVEAGLTSIHWIVSSATELSIAKKMVKDGNVPLRIFIIITANIFANFISEPPEPSEESTVKIGGVLVFADGYLAAQTAALNEPYADKPAVKGELLYTQTELNTIVTSICNANLQVIIHAMGDRAVEAAVKAFEAIPPRLRAKNHDRLEQAALLNKQLIQRIRKQGIVVSIQPKVVESEFSVWSAVERLGEKQARMLYPVKTLLREGITVTGGSDCPMEPLKPLVGIQAATTRKFFPQERVTLDEALRLYTINAARSTSEETLKGSVEEGKLADFTILSNDPTSTPLDKLVDLEVEMTVIGGKVVYQKQTT